MNLKNVPIRLPKVDCEALKILRIVSPPINKRSNQKYKKIVPMLQLKKMIPVTGTIIFSRVKNSVLYFNNFISQKYQKKIPPDSDGIFAIILRLFNERLFSPGLIHNQMLSQFYPL